MLSGFLVVRADVKNRLTGKPYAGVARVPSYPSNDPGENQGMDAYVFGGLKDPDTNLIPSLNAAVGLCKMLSRGGRKFEIIYCRDADQPVPCSGLDIASINGRGYDVATVRTECWSITEDFPSSSWAIPYRQKLNHNGLFEDRADAESYLRDYRANQEWDADFPFDVVEIIGVVPR